MLGVLSRIFPAITSRKYSIVRPFPGMHNALDNTPSPAAPWNVFLVLYTLPCPCKFGFPGLEVTNKSPSKCKSYILTLETHAGFVLWVGEREKLCKGLALPHHWLLFVICSSLRSQEMANTYCLERKENQVLPFYTLKGKKNFWIFLPLVIKIPF